MPTSEPLAGSAFIRAIADDLNGNRMIRRLFDADGTAGGGGTSNRMYIHDGMQIVQIFDRPSSTVSLTDRLLWSDQVDHLISDERVTTLASAGTVYWSLANHLGNIVDVATYNSGTDTTSIVKHRQFDGFGNITLDSATGVIFVMGYTGKFLDSTTGLQNNINRWYAAPLGEWMTEDPIGFDGGDENLGRYVGNASTTYVDPSGLVGGPGVGSGAHWPGGNPWAPPSGSPRKRTPPQLRPGEEAPPKFQPGGPNDVPKSLKGLWEVSICAGGGHAWIRFRNLKTGEVHTAGRYQRGYGGRTDENGDIVIPPVAVPGVQWDRDLCKEPGVRSGRFKCKSMVVKDPEVYGGSDPFGFGGGRLWGDGTNNCSTYARDAWYFYGGDFYYMPGPDLPETLEGVIAPPEVDYGMEFWY